MTTWSVMVIVVVGVAALLVGFGAGAVFVYTSVEPRPIKLVAPIGTDVVDVTQAAEEKRP